MKKVILTTLSALALTALAACSSTQSSQTTATSSSQVASSSTSQASNSLSSESTSQASSSSTSSQAQTTLPSSVGGKVADGTYTAQHEGDTLTLTISGGKGQLTEVEVDGHQEIDSVTVDESKGQIIIGDDVKLYEVKGNQLIVDDWDRELDDQMIFTKQ